jgi:hypothetical protein
MMSMSIDDSDEGSTCGVLRRQVDGSRAEFGDGMDSVFGSDVGEMLTAGSAFGENRSWRGHVL